MKKMMISALAVAALGLVAVGVSCGQVAPAQAAPDFTLPDTAGQMHKLSDNQGKYVVLEWYNPDCPFVKKHYDSGNMQALQKEYTGKGVTWLSICSSAPGKQGNYPPEQHAEIAKAKGSAATAVLLDPDGKVGRQYGAKTTPHMFVISPEGKVIYQGAIDDKPSTDQADVKTARNFVRAALDAALAGKYVDPIAIPPYGCSVKY